MSIYGDWTRTTNSTANNREADWTNKADGRNKRFITDWTKGSTNNTSSSTRDNISYSAGDTAYALRHPTTGNRDMPAYVGYGTLPEKKQESTFGGYEDTLNLIQSNIKPPSSPDTSWQAYLKWGGIGAGLGLLASAAYTNTYDEDFNSHPSVKRRRRVLARNLILGAGGGALLSLLVKHLAGK